MYISIEIINKMQYCYLKMWHLKLNQMGHIYSIFLR